MSNEDHNMRRLATNDLEIGVTDALERHITRHVVPAKPVSNRKLMFEHRRPRILRECMAEATGVFFYVFPGIAAVGSFYLALPYSTTEFSEHRQPETTAFGNILTVGFAFAIGIAFAIITCAPTSGGHFNPAITICLALWQGFPWRKVPHYIFSQIFGAFMAGMVLMGAYWPEISAAKNAQIEAMGTAVFNGGAASILCVFPNPNQTNQGFLFFQEFFVDSFIGIVIWACLDPANPFVTPASVPYTIGFAYGAMVWGFAANTISTNLARDFGTRIVAAIFFGREAFTYLNSYSWISILVNVPATIFATAYYEFLMRDSLQKVAQGHASHEEGDEGLTRHLSRVGAMKDTTDGMGTEGQTERGYMNATGQGNGKL
ncbi:MAG: hypothetical protein Q9160_005431 [Pyrenula sp. 1 TL-2023]